MSVKDGITLCSGMLHNNNIMHASVYVIMILN